MELRIANKFRLGQKIGNGAFREIYLGSILSMILPKYFLNYAVSL